MKSLTKRLLESEASKYDELIGLVDSNETAAQVLDDTTYVIAGVLNGGLSKLAESETYYDHYSNSMSILATYRSYYEESGPIGSFLKLMRESRSAIRDYKMALSGGDQEDAEAVYEETFSPVAETFEQWLYNDANLEALCSSLIDMFHKIV